MKTITDTQVMPKKEKEIMKKVFWSGTSTLLTIDPSIVRKLNIDNRTYFEEVITDTGINLILHKLA